MSEPQLIPGYGTSPQQPTMIFEEQLEPRPGYLKYPGKDHGPQLPPEDLPVQAKKKRATKKKKADKGIGANTYQHLAGITRQGFKVAKSSNAMRSD